MPPMKIQTTGLQQVLGGKVRLRAVIIGPGDSGKTRFASYAPKPIYANCEAGLGSVADRKVAFVDVNSSQDMLDLLEYLRRMCMTTPWEQRQFHTLVIDTVDAFERKVKDEWLRLNPSMQAFSGYAAWGYLETKMQMLLTRMLNLDMHILVLAHHKDKTIREGTGENATERQELGIRLQGAAKDNIFDDFDLVMWMGTFFEAVDGQRVQKRGLTGKKTPERPFLKDRLDMTPPWIEVDFSSDEAGYATYQKLFARLEERLGQLEAGEEIGEIPTGTQSAYAPTEADITGIVTPGRTGALPPQAPAEEPLASRSKNDLLAIAKELGVQGVKGNTLKSELLTMIEAAGGLAAYEAKTKAATEPEAQPQPEPEPEPAAEAPVMFTEAELAEAANLPQCAADDGVSLCMFDKGHAGRHSWESPTTDAGEPVNTATGQIADVAETAAIKAVAEGAGGAVVTQLPVKPAAPAPGPPRGVERPADCTICGNDINADPAPELTGGKPISPTTKESYIRVAWIKHRAHMCSGCYLSKQGRPA